MYRLHEEFTNDFPELREHIKTRCESDPYFCRLYKEFLRLGEEIRQAESGQEAVSAELVREMREMRIRLHDLLFGHSRQLPA